jgi:hypothetical protein
MTYGREFHLTQYSPCYRLIVVYYFQSAREKAGLSSRVRRRDEAEVAGANDGPEEDAEK